jgi:hypothetical protein
LKAVTGWVARCRRRTGSRPSRWAGTVHTQVVLVLRWLRHRLDVRTLAADAGLSIATAYRYVHEGLDAIAVHARTCMACSAGQLPPGWRSYVSTARRCPPTGWQPAPRRATTWVLRQAPRPRRQRAGPHRPPWRSAVGLRLRPGSTHDLTAAREMVLPALYPYAARGLPVLTDKGYTGAGLGIHVPIKRQPDGPLHTGPCPP